MNIMMEYYVTVELHKSKLFKLFSSKSPFRVSTVVQSVLAIVQITVHVRDADLNTKYQ
jgi:hypothetical protein